MSKLKIEIDYDFCQWSELTEQDKQLIKHAKEAVRNSYANYSHFHVGAALQLHDGRIVIGANQENAAFPSGLCAERAAIFAAQSQAPEQAIDAIAVAAHNEEAFLNDPISPCGACRQVMLEMEDRYKQNLRVLLYGTAGIYIFKSVKDLMPFAFVDENMRK